MQLILAKVKACGLKTCVKENEDANFFVRSLLALPLLPHEHIQNHFENMVNNLNEYLQNRFRCFIAYFQNQWLRRIGVEGFSVFGLQNRTNNVIEAFHAVLLRHQGVHPYAWSFFCKVNYYDVYESLYL